MPKKPIDYSRGLIYSIVCKTDETLLYIGSTTELRRRKNMHKSDCNNEKSIRYNLQVYVMIRSNGGWDNFNMTPVKEYACVNKIQLVIEEERVRKELNANLNSIRAYLSPEERKQDGKDWYKANAVQIAEHQKVYRKDNAEHIAEYQITYRKENVEHRIEQSKIYYKENVAKINEYQKYIIKKMQRRLPKIKKYIIKKMQRRLPKILKNIMKQMQRRLPKTIKNIMKPTQRRLPKIVKNTEKPTQRRLQSVKKNIIKKMQRRLPNKNAVID